MTDYAIPIVWANYPISTPVGPVEYLGHAGVVLVDGATGHTRYFEYGRYESDSNGNPIGVVRSRPVPNLSFDSGKIDGTSLQNMITSLNGSAGAGTPATGTILSLGDGGYDDALAYALQAQNDELGTLGEYSWANDNHCYSFAKAVAAEGGSWVDWFDGFGPFDNVPSAAMINLIAANGGFFIGGPEGNILLGNASGYATKQDFDNCFLAGTPVDMWPTDPNIKPGPNGLFDEAEIMAKVWQKPIEEIKPEDWVLSFDKNNNLKPGKVKRIFTNSAKIILDFFGTGVTPGHVYYRADSEKAYKFETLIDILRDDGVIVQSDGTELRTATGLPTDDPRDNFVWAVTGDRNDDGSVHIKDKGRIRLGTRFITDDGRDLCINDLIEAGGGMLTDDGLVRLGENGSATPFHWALSDTLPRPEDYILERSGASLEDIYRAAEWESQRPHMPPPMVIDGGPVQPLSRSDFTDMPRNVPLEMQSDGYAASSRPALNRKQRKAAEAKSRRSAKSNGKTVH